MQRKNVVNIFCFISLCMLSYCFVSAIASGYCNDNVITTFHTKCQLCSMNADFDCPPETIKLTNGRGKSDCRFNLSVRGSKRKIPMIGCRHKCMREDEIPKCCAGYWGPKCDKCPGRTGTCNRNGVCNDSINGTGKCVCKEQFTGYACERCANETLYGPTCENVCKCVHGICDNGIYGTGSCDCKSGYKGDNCDEWIDECTNMTCQANSRCRDLHGYVMCSCEIGYTLTLNKTCQEINACETNTEPCDENGVCTPTGPNKKNCTCADGYHGDGFQCDPIDLCQTNNGGCVSNSSECIYTGPGKMECQCLDGFEGYREGYGCEIIDVCVFNKSYCDENAICTTTGPRQFECTCIEGYGGDGKKCYPNIVERVKELNKNDPLLKNTLNMAIQWMEAIYNEELREHGPFTVFLPNDRGFRTVYRTSKGFNNFLNNTDYAKQILRQHIVVGQFKLADLQRSDRFYTLQGIPAQIFIRRRNFNIYYRYRLHGSSSRAAVTKGDILASNGVIHVIGKTLTNRADTAGNKQKTILELMKSNSKFNMTTKLIEAAGLESVFSSSNITVFAVPGTAWSTLPAGTVDYLLSEQDKTSLKSILNLMVFKQVVEVAELINMDRIRSGSGTEVSVRVTKTGKILLNEDVRIVQADIPAMEGLFHVVDKVLLATDIYDLLPNRCNSVKTLKIQGGCGPCHRKLECPLATDTPLTEISTGCKYSLNLGASSRLFPGCARMCNRTVNISSCCPGFHGEDCRVCPGGFLNPCFGNGQCAENGSCVCNETYTGHFCHLCSDRKKFGPNCTQSCTCLHGTCDNRIKGTGECLPGTCHSYSLRSIGKNCDMVLKRCPSGIRICHSFSMCVIINDTSGDQGCICKSGYEENNILKCIEIDPCAKPDRGGCHLQAKCVKTGPGTNECHCEDGWVGDGSYCYRGTHCDDHIDCHDQGVCQKIRGNSKEMCVCRENFHGNGTWCVPNDQCDWDRGGCDLRANCTPTGPGKNNCTCWEGYAGDGRSCTPTIAKLIEEHPNLTLLTEFLRNIPEEDNLLLSFDDKFTLFAPTDTAMRILKKRVNADYWKRSNTILNFFRFHMLIGLNNINKLSQLVKVYGKFETLFDGFYIHMLNQNGTMLLSGRSRGRYNTRVLQADLVAVNGYVHIIDRALETFFTPDDTPTIEDFFVKYPEYSVFGNLLKAKGIIDDLENMNEYTLFVPTNSSISKFYNSSTVTKKYLQYYIIPSMRFLDSFDDKEKVDTLLGPTNKLIFITDQDKIFVNEAQITKPDMLTDGGVVHGINEILSPLLHRCDVTNISSSYTECMPCSVMYYTCPQGYVLASSKNMHPEKCLYKHPSGKVIRYAGCKGLCEKVDKRRECCDGYYGEHCFECPGGPEFPCNKNGICNDSISGSGLCQCNPGYTGTACEFCTDGNSTQSCSRTCRYNNGGCSKNAKCIENNMKTTCRCLPGFVGDGNSCDVPCNINNGGCHINATCQFDGVKINCTCQSDMIGDGFTCLTPNTRTTTSQTSKTAGSLIAGITVGIIALIGIAVATALFIRWKLKSTGDLEIWNRIRRDSDASFAKLQPSEDESSVTQPLSPADINFDNPLYNVQDDF